MLRNPVERAHSHYLMGLSMGLQRDPSFYHALMTDFYSDLPKTWGAKHLYVELGFYAEQISRYTGLFPRDQIFICFFEDLIQSPEALTEKLSSFLETAKPEQIAHRKANAFKKLRKGIRDVSQNKKQVGPSYRPYPTGHSQSRKTHCLRQQRREARYGFELKRIFIKHIRDAMGHFS